MQSKAQLTSAFPLSSIHPPPAFGSSPNLEALALAAHDHDHDHDEGDNSVRNNSLYSRYSSTLYFPCGIILILKS